MSTNILFLHDNLLDAAILVASGENADLPVENLQDEFRTKVFESDLGTFNIVIDHGAAKAVTCIAIVNYNWDSEPTTFDLEFNAADAWGAPAETVDLAGTWVVNPDANGNRSIIIKTFASKSYRYNRLNIIHADVAQIGRIYLGTYITPSRNYLLGDGLNHVDPSIIKRSADGQEHADVLSKYRTMDFSFRFDKSEYSEIQSFQKIFNSVGKSKDLIVAFNYDSYPAELTWYGKFTDYRVVKPYYYDVNMSFKEST